MDEIKNPAAFGLSEAGFYGAFPLPLPRLKKKTLLATITASRT